MHFFHHRIFSGALNREVWLDIRLPLQQPAVLLLVNDGQQLQEILPEMDIPVCIAGIHAGPERRQEYGVAGIPDYQGQGAKAAAYTQFVMEELLPFLRTKYPVVTESRYAFAGFSLGGLSAFDIVWRHPETFSMAGVFSGSLWWRSHPLDEHYNEHEHRIMHRVIREGTFKPGMQFFFECGTADETADRNHNGIIDSIDDTLDLIQELNDKGYRMNTDIHYLEIPDGRHDAETWKIAIGAFLRLGYFV
ncbi:MAG TPA: alpha/beta hydrolase-fold protein [Chitinophaga sp.]|uniref:alpha/beta hydrolase n=1 Tax=Chitinophaga sp. TaxID=1869181 RepID=UPI002B666F01|nr:alpha/beta hydrolase-fold protein [Chitinophaga sp.]HVI48587.1 alpha/beta hydrolase-fold protein [Chitinophaga sp.]